MCPHIHPATWHHWCFCRRSTFSRIRPKIPVFPFRTCPASLRRMTAAVTRMPASRAASGNVTDYDIILTTTSNVARTGPADPGGGTDGVNGRMDALPNASGIPRDTDSTDLSLHDQCLQERYWSFFLASSLITFFVGLILILSWKLIIHFVKSGSPARQTITRQDSGGNLTSDTRVGCLTRLKWYAEECISGQTVIGRIMVSGSNV